MGGVSGAFGTGGGGGLGGSSAPASDGGAGLGAGVTDANILTIPDGASSIEDVSSVEVAAGGWVNRTPDPIPPTVPSRRWSAAMAYDANRHKMVLTGGSGGDLLTQILHDTLEWDGTTGVWSDLTPPLGSGGGLSHNLIFDDRFNRVLMFGGDPPAVWFEAWDGDGQWTEIGGPNFLPGRSYPAVTFDSGRGKVVIFGGAISGTSMFLDGLWEWEPVAGWVDRTPSPRPAAWPPARGEPHSLAYDSARGRSVLFSGSGRADLWEWDGVAGIWTNRTPSPLPAAWPPALYGHALVYDPVRRRTLVLGGQPAGDTPPLDGVWEWDGATGSWTEHLPGPTLQDWPLPRFDLAVAYDSDRHRIVMVGGMEPNSSYSRQTWEWNGETATFTDRTIAAPWPRAREQFTTVFDTQRGKLVVYGGGLGPESFRDLWEWDGASAAWTDRTPRVLPPSWPSYGGLAAAYDQDRGRLVSIGAYGGDQGLHEWDPVSGAWIDRTPSPLPESWPRPRSEVAMAYDAKRKRIVLVLGQDPIYASPIEGGNVELWELDPVAVVWRKAMTSFAPRSRGAFALAYDSRRGSVVLFGGHPGVIGLNLRDLWEWDGGAARWIDRTPSPLPAIWPDARIWHRLAYSAARGRIVLFGGMSANADTWEWDGVTGLWQVYRDPTPPTWSGPPVWPAAREGSDLGYDPARGAVLLFGGRFRRDIWEWGRP